MCSSQALIWQGFAASESKDMTAVWGGTQWKGKIMQLPDRARLCHRHYRHLLFIRVPTVCLVCYRLQASLCLRRAKQMKASLCQRWNKHTGSIQGTCNIQKDATYFWVLRLYMLVGNFPTCVTGLRKQQRWDWKIFVSNDPNIKISDVTLRVGPLSFFPRNEVKEVDRALTYSSATFKMLNPSENAIISGRLL